MVEAHHTPAASAKARVRHGRLDRVDQKLYDTLARSTGKNL